MVNNYEILNFIGIFQKISGSVDLISNHDPQVQDLQLGTMGYITQEYIKKEYCKIYSQKPIGDKAVVEASLGTVDLRLFKSCSWVQVKAQWGFTNFYIGILVYREKSQTVQFFAKPVGQKICKLSPGAGQGHTWGHLFTQEYKEKNIILDILCKNLL